MISRIILLAVLLFLSGSQITSAADEKPVLHGKIVDFNGKPLQGASVFVYDSPDIRRPVDFISPPSGKDGSYHMVLIPGDYWAIARYKKGRYAIGPLIMGDKTSGEPKIIKLAMAERLQLDFTVMDLMEAAKLKTKRRDDFFKVEGIVVDKDGTPLEMVYAFASNTEKPGEIPAFISSWTSSDGRFTLYLPKGNYHFGASATFPLADRYSLNPLIEINKDLQDVTINFKSDNTPRPTPPEAPSDLPANEK